MTKLLCTIFLISGSSALMFETLWFRQAGLAFGNSIWASSLVLSSFMSGLALGNGLAARERGRIKNPIAAYALIEVLIAVTGMLLVYQLPTIGQLLVPLFRPLLGETWLLNALRLGIGFLLLLIPSTAMGMTLPLLSKALAKHDPVFGRVLGRLYGWNTLGAVIGVMLTEFVLVETFGVRATAWIAGVLNFTIAAIAWKVSKGLVGSAFSTKPLTAKSADSSQKNETKPETEVRVARVWQLLSAVFISGFCLLALEIIWFRFLMLFISGHSESFALMLAVILSAISLGGFVASNILKKRPEFDQEGATMAFILGLTCVMTYAFFPVFVKPYTDAVIHSPSDILSIGIPLMFPVSFLSGIFFTQMGVALKQRLHSETATAGTLTLANTIGAAFGAFSAGFIFLPTLGMEKSLFLIVALYGTCGLLMMIKRKTSRSTTLGAAVFGLSVLLFPIGSMEKDHIIVPSQRLVTPDVDARIAGIREGTLETISIMEQQWQGQPLSYRLITNSYSMSSSDFRSRRYMKLFVYWPIALHPDPKDALLISYGVGSTAKALSDTKQLERIDVVDISRDILEMNDLIYPEPATRPLNDPRMHVHIEDARYYLQTTDRSFDLITAEPPPPEVAGVVNLYTREYFQLLYDRLNEGGMATYWLPLHAMDAMGVKAILRAFCDVFKDCALWHGQWLDLMITGTRNAKGPVSDEVFYRQWQDPIVKKELEAVGFERPEQLGALFIGDAAYLNEITKNAPPLLDNFPKRIKPSRGNRLELVKLIDQWIDVSAAQARFRKSPMIDRLWPERIKQDSMAYFWFQEILHRHWFALGPQDGIPVIADLHRVLNTSSLRTLALWLMGTDADYQRILDTLSDKTLALPVVQVHVGMRALADRRYEAAAKALVNAEADPTFSAEAFNYRIYALAMAGHIEAAKRLVSGQMADFLENQQAKGKKAPPLSPYWSWMKDNLGIDPFAEAKS